MEIETGAAVSDQMWSFLRLVIREGVKSLGAAFRVCLLVITLSVAAIAVIVAIHATADDVVTLIGHAVS